MQEANYAWHSAVTFCSNHKLQHAHQTRVSFGCKWSTVPINKGYAHWGESYRAMAHESKRTSRGMHAKCLTVWCPSLSDCSLLPPPHQHSQPITAAEGSVSFHPIQQWHHLIPTQWCNKQLKICDLLSYPQYNCPLGHATDSCTTPKVDQENDWNPISY